MFSFVLDGTTDDSLSGELLPENNLHDGQTLALDIVLDTDHIDYSALGNIDPDLNILFDNNTIHCKYFTELEFNNYFTRPDNFSLFNLNIRSLPKNVVNLLLLYFLKTLCEVKTLLVIFRFM